MHRTEDVAIGFDDSFARAVPELVRPWAADPAPDPSLVILNEELATELGLDVDQLRSPAGVDLLAGTAAPDGVTTVAMAYAGHQFGSFNPGLGDGRAVLLGELVDDAGRRRDLHLKGSGPTPFARGGDGRAALGPMLREHLIGESMHALGIPTTRALAVTTTGMRIARDRPVPGAVLARVAASHLRVGTFQYASMRSTDVLARLADHAIERHAPGAALAEHPSVALLDHVVDVQARLVAGWMLVGFVHGVLNTDNTTISGESIDYGPCAFMEAHDPATVFSSIDHGGRYAFGNQPGIVQWNLTRLAEAMLPLLAAEHDDAVEIATASLRTFAPRYVYHLTSGLRAKLGMLDERGDDDEVLQGMLDLLGERRADHTTWFRWLADELVTPTGDDDDPRFDAWRRRVDDEGRDPREVAATMNRVNPLYIPRNHLVEEALSAATDGDLGPYRDLLTVVTDPFSERSGLDRYARPAPDGAGPYVTYCGT